MKKNSYLIREYESIVASKNAPTGYHTVSQNIFDGLELFLLSHQESLSFMNLSVKRGLGKVLTAKNYAGIIVMKDGTTIEILPKIESSQDHGDAEDRKLLLDMLKTLRKPPFQYFQTSNMDLANLTLLEVFIRMFLDEAFSLTKRGLRNGYHREERNLTVFKGKLLVPQQIRYNLTHRERFYVASDEYNANRPENRILKTTLVLLYRITSTSRSKADIRTLLNAFEQVPVSRNPEADFAHIVPDRTMTDYTMALQWCRVFLGGQSFSPYAGQEVALALLFPMEQLFESFVAHHVKRYMEARNYYVDVQDKRHYLFDAPTKRFSLRPDIVISNYERKPILVLDTKWKALTPDQQNHGISQSDMYQMYAYHKKYKPQKVILLYPDNQAFKERERVFRYFANKPESVEVCATFFDLLDVSGSMERINKLLEI